MSFQNEPPFVPADFGGVVRLFPLPNLVMFPHVMQPLHIFEPRYREMTEDALAGDRLIATALFESGWEQDYDGRPALKPFGCLGKIVTHHRMTDGRFNLLLVGVSRIQIVEELPPLRSYRQGKAQLLEDRYHTGEPAVLEQLQHRLLQAFKSTLVGVDEAREHLEPLLDGEIGLGALADIAAYTLDLPCEIKERLLAECHVDRRVECLLECISHRARADQCVRRDKFPPDFSAN